MNRLALALIAGGLGLVLWTVTIALGGHAELGLFTAAGTAAAGASIVLGLTMLERRAFSRTGAAHRA